MIIDDIKNNVRTALRIYCESTSKANVASLQRARDLDFINQLMIRIEDPLELCSQMNEYIEKIKLPLLNLISFLDSSRFYWAIKNVLLNNQYTEVNILKALLHEKEHSISMHANLLANTTVSTASPTYEEMAGMAEDLKLMRIELAHVYANLKQLSETVIGLTEQSQNNLDRAIRAETEVAALKAQLLQVDKRFRLDMSISEEKSLENNVGKSTFLALTDVSSLPSGGLF